MKDVSNLSKIHFVSKSQRSERSESAKYLYPDTLVNPYDVGRISELTDRLMSDIVFYKEVAETAHERAKEFDLYRLKDKLLEGIFNLKN